MKSAKACGGSKPTHAFLFADMKLNVNFATSFS